MAELTRKQIHADAANRMQRTLQQGLVIDLAVGTGIALAAWVATLSDNTVPAAAAWTILAVTVGKSLVQAFAAWLMRLKVTPPDPEA